jgi:hypothetical protein
MKPENPGTWTKDAEACATRSSVKTVEKTTSRAHMHKGASQQLTEKHRGARRGRTGPKQAWASRPRPAGPACFDRVRAPFCPRCLSIYCLYLRWPLHPSIHYRVADSKEQHREEADSHRKSSSHLGNGLGHVQATMVGRAW